MGHETNQRHVLTRPVTLSVYQCICCLVVLGHIHSKLLHCFNSLGSALTCHHLLVK